MMTTTPWFANQYAVLVTMHEKEPVIAPVLQDAFGLHIVALTTIDTDQFGMFTGEITRPHSQYHTAVAKARAGLIDGHTLSIASEGSFSPHPAVPLVMLNQELVVIVDERHGLVFEGWATSTDTMAAKQTITSVEDAVVFAQRVGFPIQGVVIRSRINDTIQNIKDITTYADLDAVVAKLLDDGSNEIWLETDLRAHRNPKRRLVIHQATTNLVQNMLRICPVCAAPGVRIVDSVLGLPCNWCSMPTHVRKAIIYGCVRCGHRETQQYPDGNTFASPEFCAVCNP